MTDLILRIVIIIICIFAIYYGDQKAGITVFMAKRTSRIVYNILLIVFFCIPFVIWYVIKDSAPVIVREFIYGISIGMLTLFGNYYKNRGK